MSHPEAPGPEPTPDDGDDGAPPPTRSEMLLYAQAANERWPTTAKARMLALKRIFLVLDDEDLRDEAEAPVKDRTTAEDVKGRVFGRRSGRDRLAIAAIKALAAIERNDLARAELARRVGLDRAKTSAADDAIGRVAIAEAERLAGERKSERIRPTEPPPGGLP